MNWNDPVDRAIEIHAALWQENSARLVRAAHRAVDDILDPVKAAKRRYLRAVLLRALENRDRIQRLAKMIQAEREAG